MFHARNCMEAVMKNCIKRFANDRNNAMLMLHVASHSQVAIYARENLVLLDVYLREPYAKLYVRREKITIIR